MRGCVRRALEPACPREQAGGAKRRPKLLLPFPPEAANWQTQLYTLPGGARAVHGTKGPNTPFRDCSPCCNPGPPHLVRGRQFLHQRQGQNLFTPHDCPSAGLCFRQGSPSFTFLTHMTGPRRSHITDAIHSKGHKTRVSLKPVDPNPSVCSSGPAASISRRESSARGNSCLPQVVQTRAASATDVLGAHLL